MQAHKRSGGICQLCGCNSGDQVNFDLWCQMSVEHVIGRIRGGDIKMIAKAIAERFPEMTFTGRDKLVQRIDEANTVTACSFCNSLTSHQGKHGKTIAEILREPSGTPDEIVDRVLVEIDNLLEAKRADVRYKIEAVREAFENSSNPICASSATLIAS
jgi:hypothetical protein